MTDRRTTDEKPWSLAKCDESSSSVVIFVINFATFVLFVLDRKVVGFTTTDDRRKTLVFR
jgi:hypothetical protein